MPLFENLAEFIGGASALVIIHDQEVGHLKHCRSGGCRSIPTLRMLIY
jgi:hypothetical protein